MLFAVKRRADASLVLGVALAAVAVVVGNALGLRWDLDANVRVLVTAGAGLAVLSISDGVVHAVLSRTASDAYRRRYRGLVEFFRPQTRAAIVSGGLLAAAEELLFRGVVLAALVERAGLGPWPAVLLAAVAFGACHYVEDPRIRPFVPWAVWEGVLLGAMFVATGSLLAVALAHAAHDVGGFWLFARQRTSDGSEPSHAAGT